MRPRKQRRRDHIRRIRGPALERLCQQVFTVGEDLPGHPTEVHHALQQPFQRRRPGLVGGEANRRRAAAAEDGDHRAQLHHLLAEPPQPELGPVNLRLHAWPSLESDLRVAHLAGTDMAQMTLKRGIAAGVAIIAAQLGVEIGAADVGTDHQMAFDVNLLRFG